MVIVKTQIWHLNSCICSFCLMHLHQPSSQPVPLPTVSHKMSVNSISLADLPLEILERIFINLIEDDPDHNPLPTLNTLIRTCKKFCTFLNNSSIIWKHAASHKAKFLHWESELRYGIVCFKCESGIISILEFIKCYFPTDLIRLPPRFRRQGLVSMRKPSSSDILRPKRAWSTS